MEMNNVLKTIYGMWNYILVISTIITILTVFMKVQNKIHKEQKFNESTKRFINYIIVFFSLTICFCGFVGASFTEVPMLTGCEVYQASGKLCESNLKIALEVGLLEETHQSSVISNQSIKAGTIVKKGETVTVYLEKDDEFKRNIENEVREGDYADINEMVEVPNVIGHEQIEATEMLTSRGLNFQVWWTEENNNTDKELYYIIDQSIPAASFVPLGSLIQLEIGPEA